MAEQRCPVYFSIRWLRGRLEKSQRRTAMHSAAALFPAESTNSIISIACSTNNTSVRYIISVNTTIDFLTACYFAMPTGPSSMFVCGGFVEFLLPHCLMWAVGMVTDFKRNHKYRALNWAPMNRFPLASIDNHVRSDLELTF